MIKYKELAFRVRRGEIAASYFFFGEESYLKEEAVLQLRTAILGAGEKDLNFIILHAGDTSAEQIVSQARTFPFMGDKKLIVVKGVDRFSSDEWGPLIEYVENPVPFTCLVLIAEKIKKQMLTHPVYRRATSLCETVAFWRLNEKEVRDWIREKVTQRGKTISSQAIECLTEEIGTELAELVTEIEKLVIYTGGRKEISAEDVNYVVRGYTSGSVFDLLRAIDQRDLAKSLKFLADLLEKGEKPGKILAKLGERVKQIIIAKKLLRLGLNKDEILRKLGLHSYFDRDFLLYSKNFTNEELKNALTALVDADANIKLGKKPVSLVLELTILTLCSKGGVKTELS